MKTYKVQTKNREVFWIADEHYWHKLLAKIRGFDDPSAMNEVLIKNSNLVVRPKDVVIHVGDFSLGNKSQTEELLRRLNGYHIIIPGDHDKILSQIKSNLFELRPPIFKVEVEGIQIINCHYIMMIWPRSHFGSWHVFAHTHGRLKGVGKSHDVGVDNNNLFPISFGELKKIMKGKPENINYIKPEDRRR
jgi:calcineurin-like phosphoesterase family protein